MFVFAILLQATAPVDCAPRGSLERQEAWFPGKICKDDVEEQSALKRAFEQRDAEFPDRPFPLPLQNVIRERLNNDLRDGPSARFKWRPWKIADFYCFEVNAKNAYGGYTGWTEYGAKILPDGKIGTIGQSKDFFEFSPSRKPLPGPCP